MKLTLEQALLLSAIEAEGGHVVNDERCVDVCDAPVSLLPALRRHGFVSSSCDTCLSDVHRRLSARMDAHLWIGHPLPHPSMVVNGTIVMDDTTNLMHVCVDGQWIQIT